MAERGRQVLIVEREHEFRDRVRGEFVFPWGVAEATELGIYDQLIAAGGHHPTLWVDYAGPDPVQQRDFAEDTPQKLRGLCIFHPQMQEALLEAARSAGAQLRRGAKVREVKPGRRPQVTIESAGGTETIAASLVAGADGRSSMARKWGGFSTRQDPQGNAFTGVLVHDVPLDSDRSICMINPMASRMVLYVPQARGRGRAYLGSRAEDRLRLQGSTAFETFLTECTRSGLAEGMFDGARQAGPLATFDGADSWVEHPYRDAVALIGDAAATSDPTWGQGLSLTLRDVRTLRDALLAHDDDADAAGHAYAESHADYYGKVRTTNSWFSRIFLERGADADAIRERVLPQLASDASLLPDTMVAGPELAPPTEEHRARIFGV